MSPTIALDARWIRSGRADGVGRYTQSLIRELLALDGPERYVLLFGGMAARDELVLSVPSARDVETVVLGGKLLGIQDWLGTPSELAGRGLDLLHVPSFLTSPFHRGYRTVVTVHDLIPWTSTGRTPQARGAWRAFFATKLPLRAILRRADRIIAVSRSTAEALRAHSWLRGPVDVVPNGVEVPAREGRETSPSLAGALLYVGRLDPYKNVEGWLREFAALPAQVREQHPLVLCGNHDPRFARPLETLARSLGIERQVRWLGTVSEQRLDELYRGAAMLVHPSRDEGFGLTVLEAMARGTPVVGYAIPALVEVAGDAARLTSTGERGGLGRAVLELLADPATRARLGSLGRARASQFTWRATALGTRAVYRAALGIPAGE